MLNDILILIGGMLMGCLFTMIFHDAKKRTRTRKMDAIRPIVEYDITNPINQRHATLPDIGQTDENGLIRLW